MRLLRRLLRELLLALPGSWAEKHILPRLRLAYDRLPFYEWRTMRYCGSEARSLERALARGVAQFNVVFDSRTVLSYGALLNMIVIARYLAIRGGTVRFAVVDSQYHNEPQELGEVQIRDRMDELEAVTRALLASTSFAISRVPDGGLDGWLDEVPGAVTVFDDFTRNRRPYYRDCFNVLNVLMAKLSSHDQDRVLFSPEEFDRLVPEPFYKEQDGPYVAWQCRYSGRGVDFGRQTMVEEFQRCYDRIRELYPEHGILVVSDKAGCDHYSELAGALGIDELLFTKNYSSDFLGDAALLMKSDFVFFFRGGGIGLFAIHSRIPFEYYSPIMNDMMWNEGKFSSWETDRQAFVLLEKHQFVKDRRLDLERIGDLPGGS